MLQRFPLLNDLGNLDEPLAWRAGEPISRQRFLADSQGLAAALPAGGPVLPMTADRYHFALALGAALLRGQSALMPPNHTPDMVARLRSLFPSAYVLADPGQPALALPTVSFGPLEPRPAAAAVPALAGDHHAAWVLTSGSTGQPMPHGKHWGPLHANVGAEAARIARYLGRPSLRGVAVVGTVPAHHMYGFESTVLIGLIGGASFAAERPFYPQDVANTLASVPRPRVLVTTPLHLKALLESGVEVPPTDLVISATAPLSPQLAARAEAVCGGLLMEIYGCTEAGQVASRRTVEGPEWETFDELRLRGNGEFVTVSGGHVPEPTRLGDVLDVISPTRFRLLGRSNDLINVAGKRSSLSHLNHHLNSIDGVHDGVFFLPREGHGEEAVRLVALVVAPELSDSALRSALRERVDAAFLPRRIVRVRSLPRDATGKLPAQRLAEWAAALLAAPASRF
ncbi:AMP-binding protein [Ramlibacter aurantiacus]|uniref:AMP-binding protein n=1 Tax=Ramlibacter aurantiacus TaxID=2801330 RepID=UPI001F203416|nr:AMP-binding protein [Ramlibacter aurantiacus]